MGVPSFLPLPAAVGDPAGSPPCRPQGHMLLWTALLFLAPAAGTPDTTKAVMRLEPPWVNVLTEDTVTLSCHGAHSPGDPSTRWFRDGVAILTQAEPSFSFKAGSNDTGDYRCQTSQTNLSDPVHLVVTSDWLLLQTQSFVLQEGERIDLRCHSWRNKPLHKISFFQNEQPKLYSRLNSSFSIPQVNVSHSGKYHCMGFIGNTRYVSRPTRITVQGSSSSNTSLVTTVVVVVGIATVASVAAGLVWVCVRQQQNSGTPEHGEMGETLPEKPAHLSDTEEAAKAQAEKTITYSLLQHPEAPEEDPTLSDYQNV